jgi:hypothetical protein
VEVEERFSPPNGALISAVDLDRAGLDIAGEGVHQLRIGGRDRRRQAVFGLAMASS